MKKISLYLLLTVLLVLTGCSERELTFDRTYPNLAKVDEFREKRKLEIEEEIRNLPNTIKETRPNPRSLVIYVPSTNDAKYAHPSQYCWDDYLECDSRMKPKHPYDSTLINLSTFTITKGNIFELYVERGRGTMPYPTKIEAYIYDKDKNLNFYQSFDVITDEDIITVTLPKEPKVYMFQFKVFYTDAIQGLSYHPISIVKK